MHIPSKILRGSDIEIASNLIVYLMEKGVEFDANGFPLFDSSWFLTERPEEILPFYRRRKGKNKTKTAICFNEKDESLYVRVRRVFQDLPIYREYFGVMPMDISVSRYMLTEVQRFNLLLNALFLAVLGINGIKIAAPIRFGSLETIAYFWCYRGATVFSVGCVGTGRNTKIERDYEYTSQNLLMLILDHPKQLLAYGKMRSEEMDKWAARGVRVHVYMDFNERSRRGDLQNVR